MKKFVLLTIMSITIFGCGDEVEFNTPAFQGDRTNRLWRANEFSASIDANGFLTITGTNSIETVILRTPTVIETPPNNPFVVGDVDTIGAEYRDSSGTIYSTNNRPDEDVSVYPELGEIWIDEIDYANGSFTGRFRFLAFTSNGLNSIGYTNGIFFKVPLVSGAFPANPITCSDVTAAAEAAEQIYLEANSANELGFIDSVIFETACNAYSEALVLQQNYCGDVDGSIQDIIDSLDCAFSCDMATANANEASSQFNTITAQTYITLCEQYAFYLQEQIQFCGDEDGSIQAIIDDLDCGDEDGDTLPNVYENTNNDTDGDLDDDDTDGDGVPDYLDSDDDGDGVPTADELLLDMNAGNPADTDGDGMLNYLDLDDDNDGIDTINEDVDGDGNPINDDTDGDGTPNYSDTDDDGDGILTIFEDIDGDGNPTNDDTDGDGIPNYLDDDDDDDGILTINEDADPNGDGDPADALDSDFNGIPDYLQA